MVKPVILGLGRITGKIILCLWAYAVPSEVEERELEPWELESQMIVSCMWMLGIEPGSSGRAAGALTTKPFLQLQRKNILMKCPSAISELLKNCSYMARLRRQKQVDL